jgi:polar amino acid transport system substrate-binding protein
MAQAPPAKLRAVVFDLPPFAIAQSYGGFTGFAIELWREIERRLGVETEYRKVSTSAAALDALRTKEADLALPGLIITVERDKEFDFSYMVWEGGQQIAVFDGGEADAATALGDLFSLLFSRTSLIWLGIALVFMVLPAHLIWFFERRRKDGILPTQRYVPGIFHALHWSATTLLTQAEQTPRHPLARVVSFLSMFAGVVFVALYTAQLTANITVGQIKGAINGPDDLPGKRVGTFKDATTIDYLRAHGVAYREFTSVDGLVKALAGKKIDAAVFVAAPLLYYAAREGRGRLRLVGAEFDKRQAGFAFPNDSPLRRRVDSALIAIVEDGTYQRIHDKWFGGS